MSISKGREEKSGDVTVKMLERLADQYSDMSVTPELNEKLYLQHQGLKRISVRFCRR